MVCRSGKRGSLRILSDDMQKERHSLSFLQSSNQLFFVFFQPFPAFAVVRQYPFHLRPEFWRVVHFQAVAQFVDHHIVDDMVRGQHQQAVEIEVALAGTAAPTAALVADGDAPVGHAHHGGEVPHPVGDDGQSLPGQCFDLFLGEFGLGGRDLRQMALNPAPLALDKAVDFSGRQPLRRTDDHTVGGDLNADAFPVAADEAIGDWGHGVLLLWRGIERQVVTRLCRWLYCS